MNAVRAHARVLLSVGPADNDHVHASRVAVGLFLPGLAVVVAGRPDLMIYAVLGSFTGMYGRAEPHRVRLTHQAQAGMVLLTGAAVGITLSGTHAPPWVLVAVVAAFAAVGSLVADRFGLTPVGPFFGIFALGAVASVPPGRVAAWVAMSICAATALFSVLVTVVSGHLTRASGATAPRSVRVADGPLPPGALRHAGRYAIAIAIAGTGGMALGISHANWAMAAAAVPLAVAEARSREIGGIHRVVHRGVHRVAGTFAGLVVTALLLGPQPSAAWLAVLVMALLFPTELFMARHYGLALGFFTPLIMLMTELAAPTGSLAFLADRAIDTLIGVAAGVAVAAVSTTTRRPDAGHGTPSTT